MSALFSARQARSLEHGHHLGVAFTWGGLEGKVDLELHRAAIHRRHMCPCELQKLHFDVVMSGNKWFRCSVSSASLNLALLVCLARALLSGHLASAEAATTPFALQRLVHRRRSRDSQVNAESGRCSVMFRGRRCRAPCPCETLVTPSPSCLLRRMVNPIRLVFLARVLSATSHPRRPRRRLSRCG